MSMKTQSRGRRVSAAAAMFAILATALLVAACGGGGGGNGDATQNAVGSTPGGGPGAQQSGSVPAEASISVASMLTWARSLGTGETDQPLKTDTFTAPLDDTTETSPG